MNAAPFFLCLLELTVIQGMIEAALLQQVFMGTLLDDLAIPHDENQIRAPDVDSRCATTKLVRPSISLSNAS